MQYGNRSVRTITMLAVLGALGASVPGCSAEPDAGETTGAEAQATTVVPGDVAYLRVNRFLGGGPFVDASFNSSGGSNTVTQLAVGQFRVDLNGLGSGSGGHVQISTLSSSSIERCKVVNWFPSGSTLQIFVNCFRGNGVLTNDPLFAVNFVRRDDAPGAEAAYVWAGDPSSSSYTPSSAYSWNSTGGVNTITHTPGTNQYSVNLPGQDLLHGTVEVTAYGSGSDYCKVMSWGTPIVNVACFTTAGVPTESRFTLLFSTGSPSGSISSSYAWADQPTASSYNPFSSYTKTLISVDTNPTPSVVSTPVLITRSSAGRYTVKFPSVGEANTPNVKVTAYGSGSEWCETWNWRKVGFDGFADVNCFNSSNQFTDTRFTVTYSSRAQIVG